jgi:hypothetical protein
MGLPLHHGLKRFPPESLTACMVGDGDAASITVKIVAMRTRLTIQFKSVPHERRDELTRSYAVQLGIVESHRELGA